MGARALVDNNKGGFMSRASTRRPTRGRTWVVGVVAVTTLLISGGAAQSAGAVVRDYQLDGNQLAATGGKVRLFVHVKKNRAGKFVPKFVGAMFAYGHNVNCDEGTVGPRLFGTQNDIRVNALGKFSYTFQSFTAKFTGKITRHGKKAAGTVSYGPNDVVSNGVTYHNCALPNPVQYTAHYTKTVH
jgi:hypothetical protein